MLPAGPGSSLIARHPLAPGTVSGPGRPVLFGNRLLQSREAPGARGWGCCLAAGGRRGWASPGCRPAGCLAHGSSSSPAAGATSSFPPWGVRRPEHTHTVKTSTSLSQPGPPGGGGGQDAGLQGRPPTVALAAAGEARPRDARLTVTVRACLRFAESPLGQGSLTGVNLVLSWTGGRRDTGPLLHWGLQDSLAPPSPILGSLPRPPPLKGAAQPEPFISLLSKRPFLSKQDCLGQH